MANALPAPDGTSRAPSLSPTGGWSAGRLTNEVPTTTAATGRLQPRQEAGVTVRDEKERLAAMTNQVGGRPVMPSPFAGGLGARDRRVARPARAAFGWESLTDAELRVVRFVAEGLTNRQVGERLFVSHRTVETHLAHVFQKLGLSTRVQLAVEAARRTA